MNERYKHLSIWVRRIKDINKQDTPILYVSMKLYHSFASGRSKPRMSTQGRELR